ncbi:EamA/RhaT family transporter [Aestuariivirga litoralis]|uniref:EamA/RhaT family transporter n=1 Tax=Aestuariivirga litoralis TaxID=2650924 RepID=A0A2W2AR15_9HYPH|nr:DMT family transporter [Aestuariivirga litoralis]PZF77831.1 EamA/RhaT family transporter [Aestuariivirga litoralis]
MDRRALIIGYSLVAAGSALFASKAIFIKLAYVERYDALLILAWRMVFALPVFVVVGAIEVARRRAEGRPMPRRGAVLGAIGIGLIGYYLAMILDFGGLLYVTAQLERLALFTYPIFLIFIGAAFFGMKLTRTSLIAALVSYLGLAVVFATDFSEGGSNVSLGTLLVLGSAVAFAVYQLMAKRYISEMGATLFTSVALSAAAITTLAHVFIVRGHLDTSMSWHYFLLAAGTGLLATVIPSFFVNAGMAKIGATSTAMISNVSPLLTIYFAVVLLGEAFTWSHALGTALVVGGVGYHTWRELRKPAREAPP